MTDPTPETSDELVLWNQPPTGRVLLVEPDEDIARMLEVRLAREGHEVSVTASGKAAMDLVQGEDFDIALVDRSLQDTPGLQLMSELHERFDPFETIVMTVDPTVELFVEALDAGAFDLVVKPFSNLKLVTSKVKNAVGKVRAERDRNELARMLHQQSQSGSTLPTTTPEEPMLSGIDLDNMSGVDPLTGLPNRRAAEQTFRTETARALRYERPLCITLCSVDDLDAVVERFGHDVADGVLRGIVSLFQGMVRDVDFVARLQGGEFFFMFPETPKDAGFVVVDRIRQKLIQTSFKDMLGAENHDEFRITASFGVSGLPTDTMNAELLRTAADTALNRAKSTGGDQVVLYDSSMIRRA